MKQSYIFWDLDGTLIDSRLGITNSVKHALRKMGRPIPPEAVLNEFIGPPLVESFQEYCGMSHEEAVLGVQAYREYFSVTGLFENELYEGVEAALKGLQALGKKQAVATSKPEGYSVRIIEHLKLDKYFTIVAGSSMDETRNTKEAVLRYAMQCLGIADPQEVLMVGDRRHDANGAAACGITCIGALWGYGSEQELQEAGAAKMVHEPCQLLLL